MYSHILIAVAPGHYDEYAPALAVARKLLGADGKISVLSVLEEIPAYVETYMPPMQMQQTLAEVAANLQEAFKDDPVETSAIIGHAANSILDWAQQHDADCIVVSSHRPGLSDYFIGSTAGRVVRHAQCPVHVLR